MLINVIPIKKERIEKEIPFLYFDFFSEVTLL